MSLYGEEKISYTIDSKLSDLNVGQYKQQEALESIAHSLERIARVLESGK